MCSCVHGLVVNKATHDNREAWGTGGGLGGRVLAVQTWRPEFEFGSLEPTKSHMSRGMWAGGRRLRRTPASVEDAHCQSASGLTLTHLLPWGSLCCWRTTEHRLRQSGDRGQPVTPEFTQKAEA